MMQYQSHKEFHETVGTYRISGGDISGYVQASTTATNRRPDVSETVIQDEDLPDTLNELTTKSYTIGRNTTAFTFSLVQNDIVRLTGNQPFYNPFT